MRRALPSHCSFSSTTPLPQTGAGAPSQPPKSYKHDVAPHWTSDGPVCGGNLEQSLSSLSRVEKSAGSQSSPGSTTPLPHVPFVQQWLRSHAQLSHASVPPVKYASMSRQLVAPRRLAPSQSSPGSIVPLPHVFGASNAAQPVGPRTMG